MSLKLRVENSCLLDTKDLSGETSVTIIGDTQNFAWIIRNKGIYSTVGGTKQREQQTLRLLPRIYYSSATMLLPLGKKHNPSDRPLSFRSYHLNPKLETKQPGFINLQYTTFLLSYQIHSITFFPCILRTGCDVDGFPGYTRDACLALKTQ